MSALYRDHRLHKLLIANMLSSIGTGITMTAVPWLLIQQSGGETAFGYMTTCMTLAMLVLTPHAGMWIDRFSRKSILLIGEAIGLVIAACFAVIGMVEEYKTWHLAVLFASGSLYYFLFYPALFAFNQEVFAPKQYKELNGVMEIQGQLATVVSGGAASMMVGNVPFVWILWLDAFTYLAAFICIWFIPYEPTKTSETAASFTAKVWEGYRYMKRQPSLFLFFLASLMPFITVMMTNYLHPIYIANVLKEDSSVYGVQSMVYGIGAACAGFIVPIWLKRMSMEASVALNVAICTFAVTMLLLFQQTWAFYGWVALIAFGNAGTRVARSSFMMEVVPNDKIGRVDGLFRALGLLFRSLLLSAFTGAVAAKHFLLPYAVLSALLAISTLVVLRCLRSAAKRHNISKAL